MHIGANDAPSSTSREIQDKLLKLISLVNEKLPQCQVWLSTPTLRTDNGKATLTESRLVNHLLNLNIDVIDDRNIKTRHLSRKGLHLNDSGSKLLARNFLEKMRLFWVDKTCSSIIKDNGLGYPLKDDSYDIPSGKNAHKEKHIEKSKGFGDIFNDIREKNINRPIIGQIINSSVGQVSARRLSNLLKKSPSKVFFKDSSFCLLLNAAPFSNFFTLTSWWRNVLELSVPLTLDL